jgi:hypothetical protein
MRRFAVLLAALLAGSTGSGCGDAAVCADGFEQQMGSCVPACADPCGDHEFCDGTPEGGVCACAPGYAGEPCEWVGVLEDPEFTDVEVWSDTKNGATVIPSAEGASSQGGIARFQSSVACSAGSVAQTVEMPSYELAEPLVASMTYRFQGVIGVVVGYGGVFRELTDSVLYPGWASERVCLGEAAYGGLVRFEVGASERLPDCFSVPSGIIEVDRFDVVPAVSGECPSPGEVHDGDAEGESGFWTFGVEQNGEGESAAQIVPGAGKGGSNGARIRKAPDSTKNARMATKISVPLQTTLPSPALRFWHKASSPSVYVVELGTITPFRTVREPLDTIIGDGAAHTYTYCVPPRYHGGVFDLTFKTSVANFSGGMELVVDEVELVSDPACGTSSELFDPSLDSAPNRWPGVAMNFDPELEPNTVRVTNDAPEARPPNSGVLEMRYTNNKARLTAETWVRVPAPTADAGPSLRFQSYAPADPGVELFWALGSATERPNCVGEPICSATPLSNTIAAGGGWRDVEGVCLPAEWAGRWFRVRLAVRPSDEALEVFDPPRSVLFDNFEVDVDPGCPGL